jgi:putative transposase
VTGRKRQLLVDTEGFVLKAHVHPAHETEATGGQALLVGLNQVFGRLELIWVDGGDKRTFREWVAAALGWRVEVVQHPDAGTTHVWLPVDAPPPPPRPSGFRVLPRRWVVERTFAWLGRNRRLSKDYEARSTSEEAWLYAAASRVLLRRLAR